MKRMFLLWIALVMLAFSACHQLEGGEPSGSESTEDSAPIMNPSDSGQNDENGESGCATGTCVVLDAKWDYAGPFSEGYAVVGRLDGETMEYNFIDWDGKLIGDVWYDYASNFSCGMAVVGQMTEDRYHYNFGYVNTSGELAIPLEYLGNRDIHPRDFNSETGMAEVNWVDENYRDCANLIDKDGNKFFAFTITGIIGYGGGENDPRHLEIGWSYDHSLFVNFSAEPTYFLATDGIYWVDGKGKVLNYQKGDYSEIYRYGDVLSAWGREGADLFDVDSGTKLNDEPFEVLEKGIGDDWLIATVDSQGDLSYGVYTTEFEQIVAPQACSTVSYSTQWYFFITFVEGACEVEQYSKDGEWKASFTASDVQVFGYGDYVDGRYVYEKVPCYGIVNGNEKTLYDEACTVLYTGSPIGFGAVSFTEIRIDLDSTTHYGVLDLETKSYREEFSDNSNALSAIYSNSESKIKGTQIYWLDELERVWLYSAEDELIVEADAVSLVKDGYYKVGILAVGENIWNAKPNGVTLCKVGDDNFRCDTYENMGCLSENRISYCKDGKWGYLELCFEE